MIPILICSGTLIYGVCAIIVSKLLWDRAKEEHTAPPTTPLVILVIVATITGLSIFALIDFFADVSIILYGCAMLANFLACGYIFSLLSSVWMKNKKK